MTWVRLKKSQVFNDKKFPVGQSLNLDHQIAKKLVEDDEAFFYDGPRPGEKMKTDLFKPKE